MARIPEEVIERLKEEVSLQRLVELAGVELRRQGKDLVGLCPFHEERTGSLVVSPEKNLWHCMGACQAGGSVIDWVMRAEGVSFRHAVELLRRRCPLGAERAAGDALDGRQAAFAVADRGGRARAVGAGGGGTLICMFALNFYHIVDNFIGPLGRRRWLASQRASRAPKSAPPSRQRDAPGS